MNLLEMSKLHVSWLAWKEIVSEEFIRSFIPLWCQSLREVEDILETCKYELNVKEVGKIGLTLNPEVGFGFSHLPEAYQINVWHFFFLVQEAESAIFSRPPFFLANNLVHEHAHYRFFKEHGLPGKDKEAKEQFERSLGRESERFALTQELEFLKAMLRAFPITIGVRMLHILSWSGRGRPQLEGRTGQFPLPENFVLRIRNIEKTLNEFASKQEYDSEMVMEGIARQSLLSSILRLELDVTQKRWPIVEIRI